MSERLCVCGHPQGRHLLARRDCKSCPGCTQFEPAESVALDVTALLAEVQDDADREAELVAELADAKRQISDLYKNEAIRARVLRERKEEVDGLRVELAEAVRKGGTAVADSIGQQAKIRELRAEVDSLRVQLEQAEHYAHDLQERGIEPAGERLYDTHVRYLCTACGARYREFHNHPCGPPLVPVRVHITFIEE